MEPSENGQSTEKGVAMEVGRKLFGDDFEQPNLKLAIVGGGKVCKSFLELLQHIPPLPEITFEILGVSDPNPDAEGLRFAEKLGIFTTSTFTDLFTIPNLDGFVELTNDENLLLEVTRKKPRGLWVMGHDLARIIIWFIRMHGRSKEQEQEVSHVRMVSEFLLQHGNERIVLLSPDFTILEASEAYLQAVQKIRNEVVGKHCYEITHGFSSPCSEWDSDVTCPMMQTLKTGESAHAIHEHATDWGNAIFCDLETYPVHNDRGELVRVIEIWRDITDELSPKWERRLKDLKTGMGKLVQEDRMISLGQLSASCVHEINNPIQGLLTFSHLMRTILNEGDPSPKDLAQFKEYLELMSSELERCGKIISGLLSFSRESSMETRDLDLNVIIKSVIELTRHRIQLQGIDLEVVYSGPLLMVRGDVNELQQCFLNLIFNAIDAMPDGGHLSVTSDVDPDKGCARVTFLDTGCGIEEKDMDHVFDPFFTTKGEGKGTGLGLSIVYGVVKGLEGTIQIESKVNRGSKIVLCFPRI